MLNTVLGLSEWYNDDTRGKKRLRWFGKSISEAPTGQGKICHQVIWFTASVALYLFAFSPLWISYFSILYPVWHDGRVLDTKTRDPRFESRSSQLDFFSLDEAIGTASSVRTRWEKCSPGSSRLYLLGVLQAKKPKSRDMSARGYARHSVCPQLSFPLIYSGT